MGRIAFISHASQDVEPAQKICDFLEQHEISCWVAPRDVRPGQEYAAEIMQGLSESEVLVLVLSEHANDSIYVKREVERAVSSGKPIFPVRIREVKPAQALEFFIASSQWIDAWKPPLEQYLQRLAEAIRSATGRTGSTADTRSAPPHTVTASTGAEPDTRSRRGAGLIIAVAVIVGVLVVAGWFGYQQFLSRLAPAQVAKAPSSQDRSPARETVPRAEAPGKSCPQVPASFAGVLQAVSGQGGAERYNTIRRLANEGCIPVSLTTDQMLTIVNGSAHRISAIRTLIDSLPKPLTAEDILKIVQPVKGAERYNTIGLIAQKNWLPAHLNTDQMLTIIDGSAHRLGAIRKLVDSLPKPLTAEDILKIVQPVKGPERYSTIGLIAKTERVPGDLSSDHIYAIVDSSSNPKQAEKLLRKAR